MKSACAVPPSGPGLTGGTRRWGAPRAAKRYVGRALGLVSGSIAVIFLTGCDQLRLHDRTSPWATGQLHNAPRSALSSTPVWGNPQPGDPAAIGAPSKPAETKPAGVRPAEAKSAEALPVNLVGLDERQLEAMLGPPTEREDKPPAKTWRYRNERCTVDLALYPDVETRVFRTLSYEVVTGEDTATQERLCLAELRSHARPR